MRASFRESSPPAEIFKSELKTPKVLEWRRLQAYLTIPKNTLAPVRDNEVSRHLSNAFLLSVSSSSEYWKPRPVSNKIFLFFVQTFSDSCRWIFKLGASFSKTSSSFNYSSQELRLIPLPENGQPHSKSHWKWQTAFYNIVSSGKVCLTILGAGNGIPFATFMKRLTAFRSNVQ